MLCSGFMLMTPGINTVVLGLALAICALPVAFIIQRKYHAAVYENLTANAIHPERSVKEWFSFMTKEEQNRCKDRLFSILNSSIDLREQVFAIQGLLGLENSDIVQSLLITAKNKPSNFQIAVLELLSKTKLCTSKYVTEELMRWLDEIEDENVIAKVSYLLAQQGLIPPEIIVEDLKSLNPIKKAAALISLKKSDNPLDLNNNKFVDKSILEMLDSSNEEQIRIAMEILSHEASHNHHQLFLTFLEHPIPAVRRKAIECFAKISNSQCRKYAKILISQIKNSHDSFIRKNCLYALGKINDPSLIRDILRASLHFRQSERRIVETIARKMGLSTVPILLKVTKDRTMPDKCRALAGRILGHLALAHLQANLHEIINVEIERAYFYYYHFHSVQQNNPDKDLKLLVEALETGYHSVLDFIVQILSSAGEVEDSELVSRLFRSRDKKLRGQVVETLERTCDINIFKSLRPLVENLPSSEVFNRYLDKKKYHYDLPELLEILSSSSSPVDKIVSLSLMKEFQFPNWRSIAEKMSSSNEELFTHFAKELF